jgi:hypothetical protein
MNEVKGYIVALDGLIWGSAPTLPAAERDATVIWMMDDPQGEAQSHPATGRLLAMIELYGGGVEWTLYRGVAMYPDEAPDEEATDEVG